MLLIQKQVKGGGHTLNLGFSSTPGVQIAMYRFADVTYDNVIQTATIGAGMIWDDVYAALKPYGMNVAGGRVLGIGVASFTLGGGKLVVHVCWGRSDGRSHGRIGHSWHANQYGLAIDTVDAFELVLPNGTVTDITASQADLFFCIQSMVSCAVWSFSVCSSICRVDSTTS